MGGARILRCERARSPDQILLSARRKPLGHFAGAYPWKPSEVPTRLMDSVQSISQILRAHKFRSRLLESRKSPADRGYAERPDRPQARS